MPTHVTSTPRAALRCGQHFSPELALETDCWDVHETLKGGSPDFVLLDVRGRAALPGRMCPAPSAFRTARSRPSA